MRWFADAETTRNLAVRAPFSLAMEEWRKVAKECSDDIDAVVAAEVERIETEYDKHRLAQLIQSGGLDGGPALAPAHDETPGKSVPEESSPA